MTAAPVGIIDADDAADVGRVLSKGRDQTRIGHAADLAVAAVDRHDAADVAAAKDVTAVRIVLFYAAAGKATGQTAHKPAAEHVALAGLAVLQRNILAVADKAADEIALEGAGVGQCAGFVEARLDLLLELGLGQVAAGHAFAAFQGHAPAVARNAAEELPQHQAARIALGIALIVGARADRAVVPQARQHRRRAGICACRKQVADDAARKAVAGHKAVVDDVRITVCFHLGSVHRAEHAAHADAAPEGALVIRLGCRGSVAGLLGLLVWRCGLCNGLRALVHKQTRHRHVRRDCQILHDGIRFGYGNADETANAARLVFIIGIVFVIYGLVFCCSLRCGGFVVKRQRRGHQRTRRGVRAAGQGAVFQRAGVDAAECADGANIAPVLVVLRQRRDEFGCGQLELVFVRQRIGGDGLGLDVDLNVRVAQCDVRNFALVLADKADIVVGQLGLPCPAGFCNGLAAQLQIEDGHTGRLGCNTRCFTRKFDFFAQLRDRRPGDRVIEGRHLGRRPCARGAVDRDAAARPVQAGAVAGLGGQRVDALVGDVPVGRPAQVVQMAEIFQVGRVRRAALGQQGVFLVRRFLFAGCVGVAVVLPRLGAHGNVDVLRVVQQAGDAVQARGGNVSAVLTRAQQRRVRHGVQRQHKAALVVA